MSATDNAIQTAQLAAQAVGDVGEPDCGDRLVRPDARLVVWGQVVADGAERARVTASAPGSIDVALGTDRYRLPATVQPDKNGS